MLRRDEISGRWSSKTRDAAPHKPLLLLAILDGAEREHISAVPRVELSGDLQERFYLLWRTLMGPSRSTNIALPFYHLSSDELWKVTAADGSRISPEDARSLRHLRDVGAFAQVDLGLSKSLGDPNFRKIAIDTLLTNYFDTDAMSLLRKVLGGT